MNESTINKMPFSKELDAYYLSGLHFEKLVNLYQNNIIYFFNLQKHNEKQKHNEN